MCIQYVGQTSDEVRLRWNNYNSDSRKSGDEEGNVMQKHLQDHFLQDYHNSFLKECYITLTDKTDAHFPIQKGKFWIMPQDI